MPTTLEIQLTATVHAGDMEATRKQLSKFAKKVEDIPEQDAIRPFLNSFSRKLSEGAEPGLRLSASLANVCLEMDNRESFWFWESLSVDCAAVANKKSEHVPWTESYPTKNIRYHIGRTFEILQEKEFKDKAEKIREEIYGE